MDNINREDVPLQDSNGCAWFETKDEFEKELLQNTHILYKYEYHAPKGVVLYYYINSVAFLNSLDVLAEH